VQAEGAFDNINNKPDVKGKVLSEAPPHAPGRRYRKPRLAASGEAFGQVRGGVGMPFWAVICYHKGCLLPCSHKRTAPQGLMSTAPRIRPKACLCALRNKCQRALQERLTYHVEMQSQVLCFHVLNVSYQLIITPKVPKTIAKALDMLGCS